MNVQEYSSWQGMFWQCPLEVTLEELNTTDLDAEDLTEFKQQDGRLACVSSRSQSMCEATDLRTAAVAECVSALDISTGQFITSSAPIADPELLIKAWDLTRDGHMPRSASLHSSLCVHIFMIPSCVYEVKIDYVIDKDNIHTGG